MSPECLEFQPAAACARRHAYAADRTAEPLTVRWNYEEDVRVKAPGDTILGGYGSEEGIGYGEGRGTAAGRIDRTVVWSNYPWRRTGVRMLPNLRGLITTHDGASIVFRLRGRTIFERDEPGTTEPCRLVRVRLGTSFPLTISSASPRDGSRRRGDRDQRLHRCSRDACVAMRGAIS